AQRRHRLAITGPYARVRHPQYIGFILIMTGFLFQWPTLVTPYTRYEANTPAFFPRLGVKVHA
ncbi:MAG: isoprenylcysteine carboxyl methyltransferase, partial [Proteobacteria bacterium]|nr:isoprenylcysteine carboxyl methyltransferase [Pseudomonadota bacterium]